MPPNDAVNTLAKLTKLTPEQIQQSWESAKLNQQRLSACTRHQFVPNVEVGRTHVRTYTCTHCSGTVSATAQHWYEIGIAHSKMNTP